MRLVLGPSVFKCWISGDGKHWGRLPEPPRRNVAGGFRTVGLYCQPGEEPREITLKRLSIRELSGVTSLAPVELRERAPVLDDPPDIGAWLAAAADSQPKDVDADAWRQACAIRTLAGAPAAELARDLIRALVAEGLGRDTPANDRLRLLDEAALISDCWDAKDAAWWADRYAELGERLHDEGAKDPCSVVSRAGHVAHLDRGANSPVSRTVVVARVAAALGRLRLAGRVRVRPSH